MNQYIQTFFSCVYKLGIDFVSPPFCAYCKNFLPYRTILCFHCSSMVCPIVSTNISITKKYSMNVFAISDYKVPLKSLILAKGWSDIVASRQLGELIWRMTSIKNMAFDYLIPIPLHWTRFAKRGFNQSDEIAAVLAQKSKKKSVNLLNRVKRTQFQSGLTQEGRGINVKNAFALKNKEILLYKNKHLLLVDDLMTTGSTLYAAACTLLTLKPASLSAVVVCRVL